MAEENTQKLREIERAGLFQKKKETPSSPEKVVKPVWTRPAVTVGEQWTSEVKKRVPQQTSIKDETSCIYI